MDPIDEGVKTLFEELRLAAFWHRPSILVAAYRSKLNYFDASFSLTKKLQKIKQTVVTYHVTTANFDIPLIISEIPEKQNKIFYAPLINKLENQKIGALSLGEQRYFEVLLIMNLNHPFILLDEPFSTIEPLYKEAIKENILAHQKTKGCIITDHYYQDVMNVANKKIIIKEGISHEVSDLNDLIEFGYLSSSRSKGNAI